jgi:anti-sigma factor RsiW
MSDYLDGSLSRRDRRRLEKHLAVCDACTAYLEQLRLTVAASGSATPDDLSPEVLDTLTDLFRKFHEDD